MNAIAPFWKGLDAAGGAAAVIDYESGITLSYRSLHRRVREAARQLRRSSRGLVLLFANNDVGSIVWYLAALNAGHALYLCPADSARSAGASVLDAYRPELVLWKGDRPSDFLEQGYELEGRLEEYCLLRRRNAAPEPLSDSVALLLSTSASTGSAKAVRLSGESLRRCAAQVAEALHLSSEDRYLLSLPISYVYGLSVVNSTLHSGGALVLLRGTLADPAAYPKIDHCAVTSIACVSQTFAFMRDAGVGSDRLRTVRRLTHSGSRLPPELFSYAYDCFSRTADIYLMYGQTEACGRISVLSPRELPQASHSVGKALRGGTIAIDDDGQIVYRGPGVMLGYAGCREDLALGDTCGGVLQTGDVGHLDERGNLVITGRVSRYCKVFEQRLSLDEVEAFVNTWQAAAVVEKHGILTIVFEGAAPPATASVLDLSRRFRLPPQSFRTKAIPSLPRTERGKISYKTLLGLV